jgi:hypothetical protein
MPDATGTVMRKAANIALNRLGEEMFEVVAYHLRRSYAITFDPNDDSRFSLDQLHFALSVMLGEGRANNVLQQVVDEIRDLMRYESDANDPASKPLQNLVDKL